MYDEFLEYLKNKNMPLPMAKVMTFSLFSDLLDRGNFAEENATAEERNVILSDWVALAQDKLTGNEGVAFYLPTVLQPQNMDEVAKAIGEKTKREFISDVPSN